MTLARCCLVLLLLTAACRDRPAPPPPTSPAQSAEPWPAQSAAPAEWVVDGDTSEWSGASDVVRSTDATGDADGPLDFVSIAATVRQGRLLVRVDIASVANLYSGPRDGGTAVLRIAAGDDALEFDLRRRRLVHAGSRIRLADAGLWIARLMPPEASSWRSISRRSAGHRA